jgi:hypothetical protein
VLRRARARKLFALQLRRSSRSCFIYLRPGRSLSTVPGSAAISTLLTSATVPSFPTHRVRCGGAGADVAKPRPYTLKAAALAAGTRLATPCLAMYNMVVLAIPIAFLVRIGLKTGFRGYELPALGGALILIACYLTATPTGLGATLIVSILILGRAGSWWRREAR